MASINFCTLVSDASYCHQTKAGGWAVWLVMDGARFYETGAFNDLLDSAAEAEAKAIAIGCFLAKKHFKANAVHVVTDCTGAIDFYKKNKNNCPLIENAICGLRLTFAHVKAHSDTKDARSFANNWCDVNARRLMRWKRIRVLRANMKNRRNLKKCQALQQ